MFCSRCGKTLQPEWTVCKHCDMVVGQSRFDGVPYTSAQAKIEPGESAGFEARTYTRTTYTGGDYDEQYDGDVDVATSYRPVYDYHSAPEDIRDDMKAAVMQAKQEEACEDIEDTTVEPETEPEPEIRMPAIDINDIEGFDMSKIKARPIVAKKPAGFSSEVEEYVRKFDAEPERPARRGRHLSANAVVSDDDEEEEKSEVNSDERVTEYVADGEEGMDMIDADIDEDDDYYEDEPRSFDTSKIVKIIIALVVVAALFVGGVYIAPKIISKFGAFKNEATVPVEGVTAELYSKATKLIDEHMGEEYIDGLMATHKNGGYVALNTRLSSDRAAISALVGENPGANDQLFIDAVLKIQDDIGSAVTLDAVEMQTSGSVTSVESQDRWASIKETVASFKAVNSASGLSAIIAGEKIVAELATPTPAPLTTPAPEYPTVSKGDDNEDVKKLQKRLYDLGYLDDEPDGKFGNNTQTAVKLFQQEAGLEVTGVADNATQVLLYSEDAPMTADARITPVPEPTEEPLQPAEVTDTTNDTGAAE